MHVQLTKNTTEKIRQKAEQLGKTPDDVVCQIIQFHFMHANSIYQALSEAATLLRIVEEAVEA